MKLKIRFLTNILYFVFCIENEWRKKSKREKKNYQILSFNLTLHKNKRNLDFLMFFDAIASPKNSAKNFFLFFWQNFENKKQVKRFYFAFHAFQDIISKNKFLTFLKILFIEILY